MASKEFNEAVYSNTMLGQCLQRAIKRLEESKGIVLDKYLKGACWRWFEVAFEQEIFKSGTGNVIPLLTFNAKKLHSYSRCEKVWEMQLEGLSVMDTWLVAEADKVKVFARSDDSRKHKRVYRKTKGHAGDDEDDEDDEI